MMVLILYHFQSIKGDHKKRISGSIRENFQYLQQQFKIYKSLYINHINSH